MAETPCSDQCPRPFWRLGAGRRRPVEIPVTEFILPYYMVVVAIGTKSNPLITSTSPDLKVNKWGRPWCRALMLASSTIRGTA
jgi:NADPH-dependent glutamate synthase beta subunit-like oxidoreductase